MDTITHHSMSTLFDQLGLDSDSKAIEAFVKSHRGLAPDVALADAPFWSPSQADFLRQKLGVDDDWALIVDELDTRLRDSVTLD